MLRQLFSFVPPDVGRMPLLYLTTLVVTYVMSASFLNVGISLNRAVCLIEIKIALIYRFRFLFIHEKKEVTIFP